MYEATTTCSGAEDKNDDGDDDNGELGSGHEVDRGAPSEDVGVVTSCIIISTCILHRLSTKTHRPLMPRVPAMHPAKLVPRRGDELAREATGKHAGLAKPLAHWHT